jgi:hypothetical protein
MFSGQDKLPRLPINDLETAVQDFLRAAEPLLSSEEFAVTKQRAEDFLQTDGARLHGKLVAYDEEDNRPSYLEVLCFPSLASLVPAPPSRPPLPPPPAPALPPLSFVLFLLQAIAPPAARPRGISVHMWRSRGVATPLSRGHALCRPSPSPSSPPFPLALLPSLSVCLPLCVPRCLLCPCAWSMSLCMCVCVRVCQEFWEDAYLTQRSSIAINTNPFFTLEDDPTPARTSQIARATSLVPPCVGAWVRVWLVV